MQLAINFQQTWEKTLAWSLFSKLILCALITTSIEEYNGFTWVEDGPRSWVFL